MDPALSRDDRTLQGQVQDDELGVGASSDQNEALRKLDELRGQAFTAPSDRPSSHPSGPLESGFELLEELGRGAFGRVHRAVDRLLGREVAIKISNQAFGRLPREERERILGEARSLAKVSHRGVVQIYAVAEFEGKILIAMELVRGKTLLKYARDAGFMSAAEAAQIGIQLCSALAAVHQAGLVHRDIKPANIMRAEQGRCVLLDLGFAVATQIEDAPIRHATAGTPLFMAPEQLGLGGRLGPQVDIYAAGVSLYWLVSGCYPIEARTLDAIRATMSEGKHVPLRDRRPDVSPVFESILERATALDLSMRYATAGEFMRDLRAFLADEDSGDSHGLPRRVVSQSHSMASDSTATIVRCGRCDTPRSDDESFCRACGSALFSPCPQCSSAIAVGTRYCGKCGFDVDLHVNIEAVLAEAERFRTRGELDEAVEWTARALDLQPERVDLAHKLRDARRLANLVHNNTDEARAFEENGRYTDAARLWKRVIAACPEHANAKSALERLARRSLDLRINVLLEDVARATRARRWEAAFDALSELDRAATPAFSDKIAMARRIFASLDDEIRSVREAADRAFEDRRESDLSAGLDVLRGLGETPSQLESRGRQLQTVRWFLGATAALQREDVRAASDALEKLQAHGVGAFDSDTHHLRARLEELRIALLRNAALRLAAALKAHRWNEASATIEDMEDLEPDEGALTAARSSFVDARTRARALNRGAWVLGTLTLGGGTLYGAAEFVRARHATELVEARHAYDQGDPKRAAEVLGNLPFAPEIAMLGWKFDAAFVEQRARLIDRIEFEAALERDQVHALVGVERSSGLSDSEYVDFVAAALCAADESGVSSSRGAWSKRERWPVPDVLERLKALRLARLEEAARLARELASAPSVEPLPSLFDVDKELSTWWNSLASGDSQAARSSLTSHRESVEARLIEIGSSWQEFVECDTAVERTLLAADDADLAFAWEPGFGALARLEQLRGRSGTVFGSGDFDALRERLERMCSDRAKAKSTGLAPWHVGATRHALDVPSSPLIRAVVVERRSFDVDELDALANFLRSMPLTSAEVATRVTTVAGIEVPSPAMLTVDLDAPTFHATEPPARGSNAEYAELHRVWEVRDVHLAAESISLALRGCASGEEYSTGAPGIWHTLELSGGSVEWSWSSILGEPPLLSLAVRANRAAFPHGCSVVQLDVRLSAVDTLWNESVETEPRLHLTSPRHSLAMQYGTAQPLAAFRALAPDVASNNCEEELRVLGERYFDATLDALTQLLETVTDAGKIQSVLKSLDDLFESSHRARAVFDTTRERRLKSQRDFAAALHKYALKSTERVSRANVETYLDELDGLNSESSNPIVVWMRGARALLRTPGFEGFHASNSRWDFAMWSELPWPEGLRHDSTELEFGLIVPAEGRPYYIALQSMQLGAAPLPASSESALLGDGTNGSSAYFDAHSAWCADRGFELPTSEQWCDFAADSARRAKLRLIVEPGRLELCADHATTADFKSDSPVFAGDEDLLGWRRVARMTREGTVELRIAPESTAVDSRFDVNRISFRPLIRVPDVGRE